MEKKIIIDEQVFNVPKPLRMVFQTPNNGRQFDHPAEKFTTPSLAVPDETLTIQQLVQNHMRGIPGMTVQKEPIYLGDEWIDPNMDNIDRQDMLDEIKSQINALRTEAQLSADRKKQQKEDSKIPPKEAKKSKEESQDDEAQRSAQAQRSGAKSAE